MLRCKLLHAPRSFSLSHVGEYVHGVWPGLIHASFSQGSFNRPNIEYVVRHKELIGGGSEECLLEVLTAYVACEINGAIF